jgi:predicted RNA-binding protein with PIN domain
MLETLIIDGYNLIYAGDDLKELMRDDPEAAREKLLAEVEEYCAREERTAEVVFDAAGRKGPVSHEDHSGFLKVTYTAEGRSADSYIEKLAYQSPGGPADSVMLVTGDYDQQKVAAGTGLLRMSSREFLLEMRESRGVALERDRRRSGRPWRVNLGKRLPDSTKSALEQLKKQQ